MDANAGRQRGMTLQAFAIIYFVWGSTFLAIRVGVAEMPPLVMAAMRFLAAGLVIYVWLLARGGRSPTPGQWLSASVLGFVMFVVDYGLLFWAETRVPSGLAAVVLATIPLFMALAEILFLRTQRLTPRLVLALLVGLAGVAVLMIRSLNLAGEPVDTLGAVALLTGSISWSIASVLTRKFPLPESKAMSAGTQMLTGGVMLTIVAGSFGEYRDFHPGAISLKAWLSLVYLIVAGSIIAFTAYTWLIHRESPTKVGTYAYVNPVVAVILGYVLGGEALGMRTILGTLCVLTSVVLITRTKARQPAPVPAEKATP